MDGGLGKQMGNVCGFKGKARFRYVGVYKEVLGFLRVENVVDNWNELVDISGNGSEGG